MINQTKEEEIYETIKSRYNNKAKVKRSATLDELAEYIANTHQIITVYKTTHGRMFTYINNKCHENGKVIIKLECERILKEFTMSVDVNDIIKRVKQLTKINEEDIINIVEKYEALFIEVQKQR